MFDFIIFSALLAPFLRQRSRLQPLRPTENVAVFLGVTTVVGYFFIELNFHELYLCQSGYRLGSVNTTWNSFKSVQNLVSIARKNKINEQFASIGVRRILRQTYTDRWLGCERLYRNPLDGRTVCLCFLHAMHTRRGRQRKLTRDEQLGDQVMSAAHLRLLARQLNQVFLRFYRSHQMKHGDIPSNVLCF